MALRLEGLELRQDDFVLRADLGFAPGLTAVIGPSGGGKSTLLAAIGGFLDPAAGRITWDGADLAGLPPARRPVATLFQDHNLFPHLTVAENVGLALSPRLRLSGPERARVSEVLGRVGLDGLDTRRPAALSGGQQSRAALARVLLQDRPVVCLDEPFSALGPGQRADMLALAAEMLAGRTVILVSHDPDELRDVAAAAVIVDDGIARGPFETGALLADPPPDLARYLGRA